MQNFEQLGLFYLGKQYDLDRGNATDELVLYDSRHLTTHAVCVGMTGSGKTGLCLSLLEEAAIDNIPVIAIDPKGDLGNLLLTFPQLRGDDFEPWIDRSEADRQGKSQEQYARETSERWRKGLADWGQSPERIAKFRDSADVAIYTPGSDSGLPLSVLASLAPPPPEIAQNAESLADLVLSTVSGLLALVKIDSEPLTGREHILLSTILQSYWRDGKPLDMGGLLRAIQSPPFDKVGFMDLETFYPAQDRFKLAMALNNLLASPGFAAWTRGEPLDVKALFHTSQGRPRISILSIAHLSESERMFFVTLVLNNLVAWMRTQSGTSSLRAIFYMDEVFGYFPPVANPPSKKPMLTLLKQARAFGLGVVLATQNPVDLDYKGLSNAGTWFLGRLQTERDKARVLEGLEGAAASAGDGFDRQMMDAMLSRLGNRVFLLHDVNESESIVFQSRWALSYLRGPLTRDQIAVLMQSRKQTAGSHAETAPPRGGEAMAQTDTSAVAESARPVLPPEISEFFWPYRDTMPSGHHLHYQPSLLGRAKLHYADAKAGVDVWQTATLVAAAADTAVEDPWTHSDGVDETELELETAPADGASFGSFPPAMAKSKSYVAWTTALKNHLYRTQTLSLLRCPSLKAVSRLGESERDFRVRLSQEAREVRDKDLEALREKYAGKLDAIEEKIRQAQKRVEREKAQASQSTFQAAVSFGSSLLGALVGKKRISAANVGRAATSARAAGRVLQQRGDVALASEDVTKYQQKYSELEAKLSDEIDELKAASASDSLTIEPIELRPKKSEITIERVALVWTPWWSGGGSLTKAY